MDNAGNGLAHENITKNASSIKHTYFGNKYEPLTAGNYMSQLQSDPSLLNAAK